VFYETIFENGLHTVASYDNDEEALRAIKEHHRRAVSGETGGPAGHPAERIKRVLVYERHPDDYGQTGTVNVNHLNEAVAVFMEEKALGGLVSVNEAAAMIRDLSDPVVDSSPHESNYLMTESRELSPDGWSWGGE